MQTGQVCVWVIFHFRESQQVFYAIRGRGAVENNELRGFVVLWGIRLLKTAPILRMHK